MLNVKATLEGDIPNYDRLPQKHISSPNSLLPGGIAISYGFTTRCTTVILESWSRRRQKSKPLVASTATL